MKLPIAQIGAALGELNAGRDGAQRVLLWVDGVHGLGVEDEGSLLHRNIATGVTPYREAYLRFGPSFVTSPDEVDAVLDAMGELF